MPVSRLHVRLPAFLHCAALSGLVFAGGCENRQVAVFTLQNRPAAATSLGVYYKLNGGEQKVAEVRQNVDQFGIELPLDTTGTLEAQVFAYQNDVPCALGSGTASLEMPGKYRQNVDLQVNPTVQSCTGATEPVDFPTGKMSVWAYAANDLWLAGDGGKVLHWNGSYYTKIPLPVEFASNPPNWTSIVGRGKDDVWVAGNSSAVAHYTNGALVAVKVVGPGGLSTPATDWNAINIGDPGRNDLILAGTGGIFGYLAENATDIAKAPFTCAKFNPYMADGSVTEDLTAVSCAVTSGLYYCYFVGKQGRIVRYLNWAQCVPPTPQTTPPSCQYYLYTTCYKDPSPTTVDLTGVWAGFNVPAQQLEVRIVGKGGYVLRGVESLLTGYDPAFTNPVFNYGMYLPPLNGADLNATGGTGFDDQFLVGGKGNLIQFNPVTFPLGTQDVPFTKRQIGITGDLTSLSSIRNGVFATGPNRTLVYSGPLYAP